MTCKELDVCTLEVSAYAYVNGCQGNYKFTYCPQHQTKDLRAPTEWAEFYLGSVNQDAQRKNVLTSDKIIGRDDLAVG